MVWKEPGQFVSEPIFVPRNTPEYNDADIGNGDNGTDLEEQTISEAGEESGVIIFTLLSSALQKYVQVP